MATSPSGPRAARGKLGRRSLVALVAAAALLPVAVTGVLRLTHGWRSHWSSHSPRVSKDGQPLPYVNYVPIREAQKGKMGTTIFDKARAEAGYNLYVAKPEYAATLIDMNGEVVHRWTSAEAQPNISARPVPTDMVGWQTVRMTPDGDLYATVGRAALLKLDFGSKLLWKAPVRVHHEVVVGPDGDVYALYEQLRFVEIGGKHRLVADNGVVVLSASDGSVKKRISLYDVFVAHKKLKKMLVDVTRRRYAAMDELGVPRLAENLSDDDDSGEGQFKAATLRRPGAVDRLKELYATGSPDVDEYERLVLMRATPGTPADLFHANAIVPLKSDRNGLWKDGDIMVSIRRYDLVLVLDGTDDSIVWMWGPGVVQGQHTPRVLPDGRLMLFDNGESGFTKGAGRKFSRILEIDPAIEEQTWSFVGDPPSSFYSHAEGSCQPLPKGNVLVADALSGRAFEVTRDKKIVWEYFNPKLDETRTMRSAMYRMERLFPDVVDPLLARR